MEAARRSEFVRVAALVERLVASVLDGTEATEGEIEAAERYAVKLLCSSANGGVGIGRSGPGGIDGEGKDVDVGAGEEDEEEEEEVAVVEGMRLLLMEAGKTGVAGKSKDSMRALVDAHRRLASASGSASSSSSDAGPQPTFSIRNRSALMKTLLRLAEKRAGTDANAHSTSHARAHATSFKSGTYMMQSLGGQALAHSSPSLSSSSAAAAAAAAYRGMAANGNGQPRTLAAREKSRKALEAREAIVSEHDLVSDVLKAFQGVAGVHTVYDGDDGIIPSPECNAPESVLVLMSSLCEMGWLFTKIQRYAERAPAASSEGLVVQSFRAALRRELTEYYRLVAALEATAANPAPLPGGDAKSSSSAPYLTLRRLFVWTEEPLLRMRWLAVLIDVTAGQRGGQLAQTIQTYSQHGDPFVQALIASIMSAISVPLLEMIEHWIQEGELRDPFGEFFVQEVPHCVDADMWRRKYRLEELMLPPFISLELARRILRTGKTINFLRRCCTDSKITEDRATGIKSADFRGVIESASSGVNVALLTNIVNRASSRIDSRLMSTLSDKYHFRSHSHAIKGYLLLGQGDFIQCLMDLVGPELSQSASKISALKLNGKLESAIRASNAQYETSDVLQRLGVRMLRHGAGEMGWDAFSLDYKATMPLSTIFTDSAMTKYLRIFNFLWRLKRAEYALSAAWSAMKPNAAALRMDKSMREEDHALHAEMKGCHALRSDMMHFVTNLQYHIMFEVVEVGWTKLESRLSKAADLDELIAAHDENLEYTLEHAFLVEDSSLVQDHLSQIFDLVLRFRGFADRIFEAACESSTQRKLAVMQAEVRTAAGQWGSTAEDLVGGLDMRFVREARLGLNEIRGQYYELVEELVRKLSDQPADVKFLLFRLHGLHVTSGSRNAASPGPN